MWTRGNVCLIGDSAHSTFPFYGQGLNAGIYDIIILTDIIKEKGLSVDTLSSFEAQQKVNAISLLNLSRKNYDELRSGVKAQSFMEDKLLKMYLRAVYPRQYYCQYELVSFTLVGYAKAWNYGTKELELLEKIK